MKYDTISTNNPKTQLIQTKANRGEKGNKKGWTHRKYKER